MTSPRHPESPPQQPVIDRLLASRETLLSSAVPGIAAARELSALADEAVISLAEAADAGARWAVVALGGYGCGRLLPRSDFDLLIVSDAASRRVRSFAEAVFYPLWDSGLPVGHQVRSRKEHLQAAMADASTLTASLTGRVVAGDAAFGDALLGEVAARARRARARVLRELAARARPGSPFLLYPDVKEGAGGQRDLDELTWTAAVLAGEVRHGPAALAALGMLSSDEAARIEDAADALAAARWALHLSGERRKDVLSPEAAEELGPALDRLTPAMADAANVLERVRRRVSGAADPAPLSTPDALVAALAQGAAALPRLEDAAWAGELDRVAPGLRDLMPLRRPGLGHVLTVGAHCLAAAASVADAGRVDPLAGAVLARLPDRRPLLAAALSHDAGKHDEGTGHAERGVPAARATAAALDAGDAADDVASLVRRHLLLAETATREDAADEDAVLRTAAAIASRDLVGPLYVLTVADTIATRPDLWTPWRAAVIGDLVSRLDAALSPEVEGAGIARDAEETRRAALSLLAGEAPRARAFVAAAPLRYLAVTPPAAVAEHAALAAPIADLGDPKASAVAVGIGPAEGTWRVTVATADRHGLFASLAGVVALSGLSILGAEAVSGPAGTAIDTFTVTPAALRDVDPSTWSRLERTLDAALGGRLDVEARLAERLRHYPPAQPEVPARLAGVSPGTFSTTVRVEAGDRVGLLHDLAWAFAQAGYDIRSASVMTLDSVATDTFTIVDDEGEPPSAEDVERRLSPRLETLGRS